MVYQRSIPQIGFLEFPLGIEVPVHTGLCWQRYDLNVFAKVKKKEKGYYEATLIPIR
jgi:hypothetical protein